MFMGFDYIYWTKQGGSSLQRKMVLNFSEKYSRTSITQTISIQLYDQARIPMGLRSESFTFNLAIRLAAPRISMFCFFSFGSNLGAHRVQLPVVVGRQLHVTRSSIRNQLSVTAKLNIRTATPHNAILRAWAEDLLNQ